MKKKKSWYSDDELNVWQPASDMFSALLLILMLVILLLGLYLIHIPEHSQLDPYAGDTYAQGSKEQAEATNTNTPQPTLFFWLANGGGSGGDLMGGETPHPTPWTTETPSASPTPTVSPTPDLPGGGASGGGGGQGGGEGMGEGPGDEPDAGLKSAVDIMLVDAETGRTVKEANVQFELYGENHALQVLNVYYPERISFRTYETTENGTFYMPEKLLLGSYELHELSEAEGYDASENIAFELEETHDWEDPLVVRVPVNPSKNIIRVQMTDADTGRGISGGTFDIVADENIITSDGTLRYRAGQTVGQIECNENGYGESEELYLGPYRLIQQLIPAYYVGQLEDVTVQVSRKSSVLPHINTIASERSTIHMLLADELVPERGIPGAVFSVTADSVRVEPFEAVTDASGQFVLNELEKGVTYRIVQTASTGDYRVNGNTFSISVDVNGRMDGEPLTELESFNHVIRVSIGITDEFSSVQVPNINLALFDNTTGSMVRAWTTTGVPLVFTNLEPGSHTIYIGDNTDNRYDFVVYDQADTQVITLNTTYVMHYVLYGAIAVIGLGLIVGIVIVVLRLRKKVRKKKSET